MRQATFWELYLLHTFACELVFTTLHIYRKPPYSFAQVINLGCTLPLRNAKIQTNSLKSLPEKKDFREFFMIL